MRCDADVNFTSTDIGQYRAGQTLPRNFTGVKLNANLINRVKRTWPDYDPYTDTGYATF